MGHLAEPSLEIRIPTLFRRERERRVGHPL
jgi:hypothetical protein